MLLTGLQNYTKFAMFLYDSVPYMYIWYVMTQHIGLGPELRSNLRKIDDMIILFAVYKIEHFKYGSWRLAKYNLKTRTAVERAGLVKM